MAFDLVHYFNDQIMIQKPTLLNHYPLDQKNKYIQEINALSLGKLLILWRENDTALYQEIHQLDHLYIQNISRHLTTAGSNQSTLAKTELEQVIAEIFSLQLIELKQLDETGHLGKNGIAELLSGQVEHLSGQAEDWVWITNRLVELKGSKATLSEEQSLANTVQEFNKMMTQDQSHIQAAEDEVGSIKEPTWAKILEPIVALAILWILIDALCTVLA
ncbi:MULTISPECIES: hypothetical protein [unclassified Acinetobacter]|uniref:hypothetical protein n=1 Tax=unclassified Acinetobacter TaxID=196816 RepID=UPI002934E899|nr:MULTISPECIES: hypothetical protein [unclassified Acinetobacter]WOE30379.1 hypothetical protein QSG84_08085 [Acinetobacter sp. SAAs470]WOE38570.1 hypothetical protein QSG86_01750 [Acinetobacter sp. SAAs474]